MKENTRKFMIIADEIEKRITISAMKITTENRSCVPIFLEEFVNGYFFKYI